MQLSTPVGSNWGITEGQKVLQGEKQTRAMVPLLNYIVGSCWSQALEGDLKIVRKHSKGHA